MDEFTLSEVYIVLPKTYFNLKAIFFKQKYIDISSLSQFAHLVSSLFFCDISSLLLLFSIGLHVCQCQNLKKAIDPYLKEVVGRAYFGLISSGWQVAWTMLKCQI